MEDTIMEQQVRAIAREEARKEANKVTKELVRKVAGLENSINTNTEILQRIDRLLLGEVGVNEEDTLKARANFAYLYARRNSDAKIIERAVPALKWFEDMAEVEPGCKESKLQTLGRIIGLFTKIEWVLALLGITTGVNTVLVVKAIYEWLQSLS